MLLLAVSVRLETRRGRAFSSTQTLTGDIKALSEI